MGSAPLALSTAASFSTAISPPLNDIAQLIADPQVAHRNMIVSAEDEAGAHLQMAGNPIKLSAHEDPATRPAAPALDGDRQRILAELDSPATPTKPPER